MRWNWNTPFSCRENFEQKVRETSIELKIALHPRNTLDTIQNMEADCVHLKRQTELLRLDLERLNKLIYKETTNKTALERNNHLSESDFVRELRVRIERWIGLTFASRVCFQEAEKDAIHMEEQLVEIRKERENLLANLVEAEWVLLMINGFWSTCLLQETNHVLGTQNSTSERNESSGRFWNRPRRDTRDEIRNPSYASKNRSPFSLRCVGHGR